MLSEIVMFVHTYTRDFVIFARFVARTCGDSWDCLLRSS